MRKLAAMLAAQLEKIAAGPGGCWVFSIYEPEVPQEVILDSAE